MASSPEGVEIREIPAKDSIAELMKDTKADIYIKTGKTGGKRFLVRIDVEGERPSLMALHL